MEASVIARRGALSLGVCYKRYALALRLPPAFITGLELISKPYACPETP
jgi:hypothetical protein